MPVVFVIFAVIGLVMLKVAGSEANLHNWFDQVLIGFAICYVLTAICIIGSILFRKKGPNK